ncbi:MAG: glutamate--tRNA ligase [Candidatus Zambryskibacteria bacterium RIFCSPLOWO2_01_FULL_45_43]|uniref:Glutamate--tRNA ligase n=2 Tax=Parcubacteria group TaxID=1794811 RepID=A0A1G1ZTY0_9BACT|nr:MAG: glutamate--tRNA ligase [Candidatus Harrisonbacteria bacterium RIFCSPLOWO2_02_FULL_45_10c]OHB04695.1 MAG: glutamate--tRNA ligase [Candidatus Zambryskibacteria bacterium RIFCSPLOWO2_01_FULL_45_43]
MRPVRVRIAPSPTGNLHIGTARTALFNWLFAKKYGGKFILRIEDTDLERSRPEFEKDIINGLRWLGLEWDEGPYRQSERLDTYEKYLKKLFKEDKAYYCSCSKESLEKERQRQMQEGKPTIYEGACRNKKISAEQSQLIRIKNSFTEPIVFNDLIRGDISFDMKLIGDIAIAKNLRTPLYNFAVVIDDFEMKISHVIRGEDHIANTPKQILIQQALGFPRPKYAHLPLILDPDRSKMSKRFSATSVQEYRDQGYLPEALVNFMALLGWHPTTDIEKLLLAEIMEQFSLERIQKGGAVFDIQKLNWFNAEYIKEKTPEELLAAIASLFGKETIGDPAVAIKIITVGKPRMNTLRDFREIRNSFTLKEYDRSLLIWKNTPAEKIKENLLKTNEMLRQLLVKEFNDLKNLERYLMPFADSNGRGEVLWPLRAAISGRDKSPGPFELMWILGKEETLARLEKAIQKLNSDVE